MGESITSMSPTRYGEHEPHLANKHIWALSRWVSLSVDTIDLSCSVRPRNHKPRRLASTANLDRPFEPWWLAVPIYQYGAMLAKPMYKVVIPPAFTLLVPPCQTSHVFKTRI